MASRVVGMFILLMVSGFAAASDQVTDRPLPPVLGGDIEELNQSVPDLSDLKVESTGTPEYGRTLEDRVEDLERYARENTNYLIGVDKRLTAVEKAIAKLTIKTTDGKTTVQNVPVVNTSASQPFSLPPGAVITHIDGVPVQRSTYYNSTIQAPVQTYSTPAYQISAPRVYSAPRTYSAPRMFIRPRMFGTCANGRCG